MNLIEGFGDGNGPMWIRNIIKLIKVALIKVKLKLGVSHYAMETIGYAYRWVGRAHIL